MMEDKQIGVPTNVAVFIDYENVYKALLEEKTNLLYLRIHYRQYLAHLASARKSASAPYRALRE